MRYPSGSKKNSCKLNYLELIGRSSVAKKVKSFFEKRGATGWALKQAEFWVFGVKKGPIINFPEGLKSS